jgi:hypothetical protein
MTYRSFSTETWQDPWFEKLNPNEKLLFIYLWTNDVCNQAGCYELSMRRVEFETKIKPEKIIKALRPKVEWFPENEIIWIKSFFRRQCCNEKFSICAIRSLSGIPKQIVEKFTQYNADILEKYGIDTLSIPYKTENDTLCESVTGTVTEKETDKLPSSVRGQGFEDFWKAYPKKVGKQEAKKAWERQNGNRPKLDTIVAKITELRKSSQWLKDNGQFIPHPATWLNRGGWDDEFCVMKTSGDKPGPRHKVFDPEKDFAEMRRREQERWKKDEAKK